MSEYMHFEPEQCTDCGHWRADLLDIFVYVFAEDRHLCGDCCNRRYRMMRGEPIRELDLSIEEDGALEDMIDDYSDLPLFAAIEDASA